jgi:hypothetical protein
MQIELWQGHNKGAPAAWFALHPDSATMGLDDRLADVQA